MKNAEQFKEIVLLYANTDLETVENLRKIEQELLTETYRATAETQTWETAISRYILSIKIETMIQLNNLGFKDAKTIKDNPRSIDDFMTGIIGYAEEYPPDVEQRRTWFYEAFSEIYGYMVADRCPCDFSRKGVLRERGYIVVTDDGDSWMKKHPTCLQCDHMYFTAMLEDLSAGSFRLLEESGIVKQYNKMTVETVDFTGNTKRPLRKNVFDSFAENDAVFPGYLEGLPCNVLVDLLTTQSAQQIKKCPHCGKFFFAKDLKRLICYDSVCIRKREAVKKRAQRDHDPVKYV